MRTRLNPVQKQRGDKEQHTERDRTESLVPKSRPEGGARSNGVEDAATVNPMLVERVARESAIRWHQRVVNILIRGAFGRRESSEDVSIGLRRVCFEPPGAVPGDVQDKRMSLLAGFSETLGKTESRIRHIGTTSDEAERRASIQCRGIAPTRQAGPRSTVLQPDPRRYPSLLGTDAISRPVARCTDCEESRGNRDDIRAMGADHQSAIEGHLKALSASLRTGWNSSPSTRTRSTKRSPSCRRPRTSKSS